MRWFVLLGLVIATSASAQRPPPRPLPAVEVLRRAPASSSPSIVIGPTIPRRVQPAVDERAREALQRRATTSTGLDRLAALDALTAALEQTEPPDDELELVFAETARLYAYALAEPALVSYPYADELIVRAAKSIRGADPKTADRMLEQMISTFPSSPFVYEARLQLAASAELRHDLKTARRHLEEILAKTTGMHADYARLRYSWVLKQQQAYPDAVAQLRTLIAGAEPAIAEAAVDALLGAYARAGRAELAAPLFDHLDRTETTSRLRALGWEYANLGKLDDQVTVLRDAIVRETDRSLACDTRADLVTAMVSRKNRVDVEVAIAELAEAVRLGDDQCASAADIAVGFVAYTWHVAPAPADRAQLIRLWTRAAELATTDERRDTANENLRLLVNHHSGTTNLGRRRSMHAR